MESIVRRRKGLGEWEFVGGQDGIYAYRNTVTGELDVIDSYEKD